MQVKGGLVTLLRIIGQLPKGVDKVNQMLTDGVVTATELVELGVWIIETISGKSMNELGIKVEL